MTEQNNNHLPISFDAVPGIMFMLYDQQTNQLSVSERKFKEIWERPVDEFITNPTLLLDTIHEDDRKDFIIFYSRTKNSDDYRNQSIRIITPDQREKWVEITQVPDDKIQTGYFFMLRDITLEKNYMENLLNINERKDMVIHIIAHDLRGMISHINTSIFLLEKGLETGVENGIGNYIRIIKNACKNSIEFMSDILELEYLQSSQIELKKSRMNISDRLRLLVDTYGIFGKSDRFEFQGDQDVYVELDEVKSMLIFENLLSNAYKFTPETGKIIIKVEEHTDKVRIEVHDTGIGIPEELHPHIFEKFTKAKRKGIKGEKPFGLGLHIIKHLVDLHQGKIWFESKVNVGTSFYIEFPKISEIAP